MRGAKALYETNCAMCHGKAGEGEGPVGQSYTPRPPDLRSAAVQGRSDGALFYWITNGILSTPVPEARQYLPREWHAYRQLTTGEERWAMVAYIRSLGRRNATTGR